MGDKLLMVLALAWLFSEGHGSNYTSLPCDDLQVEKAVKITITHYNNLLTEGSLLALYEVLDAKKALNNSGESLLVRFTARETDCPAGGDKDWQQCDYLNDKGLRMCHSNVLFTAGSREVLLLDCLEEKALSFEVAPCMGCPEKIDLYQDELREPLIHSLKKANSMINHIHFFIFKDLTSATKQVVAGFRYKLQFDIEKSNCTRNNSRVVSKDCHPAQEQSEMLRCNSTVDVAPWRHEVPDVHVQCEPGLLKTVSRFKRPPGWSPLRAMPMKPSKESSEESKESVPVARVVPLRCPSKPWKEFQPVNVTRPSNSTKANVSLL